MNLIVAWLILVLSLIFIRKIVIKARKKVINDERTEYIGLKAAQATFIVFTIFLAFSSFILIYFGHQGIIPSDYIYYLGVIMSYLTCLILIIYIILYVYFNKKS